MTWAFFEMNPLGLIFAALALFWFGSDLVRLWGPVRFLATYLGLAAAAAAVTCLLALVWSPLGGLVAVGAWPVISALIIAWAIAYPTRDIFVYFVLPLHGRNLIYATLAGTLLFALLSGSFASYVPHFAAELLALLALRRSPPRRALDEGQVRAGLQALAPPQQQSAGGAAAAVAGRGPALVPLRP